MSDKITIFATPLSHAQLFSATAAVALSSDLVHTDAEWNALPDCHIAAACNIRGQTPALLYKIRQLDLAVYSSVEDDGDVVIAADAEVTEDEVRSFLSLVLLLAIPPVDPTEWLVSAAESVCHTRH